MKISNGVNKKISTPIAIIIIVVCAVLVGGVTVWRHLKMPEEIKMPEIKPPEKIIDEIANWKTYRNEECGFEIKYPSNCVIKIGTEYGNRNLRFSPKAKPTEESFEEDFYICTGELLIRKNEKGLSVKEFLEDLYDFSGLRFEETKTPSGIIVLKFAREQGEEYYKKFGPLGSGLDYTYWNTGNEKCVYSLMHFQDGGLSADQMLSTFRFLE